MKKLLVTTVSDFKTELEGALQDDIIMMIAYKLF
jgi:hypothetical protein